ncbi:MAG: fliF [Pseudoduganella sp.]|jgi:flagellar M-ring protein FliF|nr:fliF [Pseudoduganella sp.]
MSTFTEFWRGLAPRARWGLAAGALAALAVTAGLGYWALRAEQRVLFADLSPRDAATMTAELERLKIPYRLENEGNTILVDSAAVYSTRHKLMGKELPLQGTVGLELFNQADIGMTDFAQKVNYQRALQGELTRTILSLEAVQGARVHLALPEQGVFKKAAAQPKAGVTLTMKPGQQLERSQVQGIQRLVASAVPQARPEDVTVVDQRGVPLAGRAGGEDGAADGDEQLDGKRSVETYLARKLTGVLDRALGVGQGMASVDVTLNQDRLRVTTESVLPGAPASDGSLPAGVLVREKSQSRPGPAGSDAAPTEVAHQDNEYQVGRRVEHLVRAPGVITRLSVAVVVRQALDERRLEQVRQLAATAVGLDRARGDAIVVHALDELTAAAPAGLPAPPPAAATVAARPAAALPEPWLAAISVLLLALLALAGRRLRRPAAPAARPALSLQEREAALGQVRAWVHSDQTGGGGQP